MSKYGHRDGNWFEAIVNKLGGEAGADRFLRGEVAVCEPYLALRDQDGVICFTVLSDGTTGEGWIKRLEAKEIRLGDYAKRVLRSSDFKSTSGVIYVIAVLRGSLFNDNDRVTSKIRAEAEQRKLSTPNAEIACLIRDKFTDEEIKDMGLWGIVAMHNVIAASPGNPSLLVARRSSSGSLLDTYWRATDVSWEREVGFGFVVSQITLP